MFFVYHIIYLMCCFFKLIQIILKIITHQFCEPVLFFSKNRIKLSDLQRFANLQADLGGSDFSKSDLTGASLEGANLEDVNFENVPRTEKLP